MLGLTGAEIKRVWPEDADDKFGQPGENAELGNELPCALGTIITIAPRTDTPGENDVNPGDYKFVRLATNSGVQPQTGDMVVYDRAADKGYAESIVTGQYSEGENVAAGVVAAFQTEIAQAGATQGARTRSGVTIQDGEFFWVQISGHCTMRQAIGNGANDGDSLKIGGTDGTLDRTSSGDERAQVAQAIDASAKLVTLNCTR